LTLVLSKGVDRNIGFFAWYHIPVSTTQDLALNTLTPFLNREESPPEDQNRSSPGSQSRSY